MTTFFNLTDPLRREDVSKCALLFSLKVACNEKAESLLDTGVVGGSGNCPESGVDGWGKCVDTGDSLGDGGDATRLFPPVELVAGRY